MKTYNKEDIIEDYRNLQLQFPDKTITRSEYRKFGEYSTSLIEKLFGSWTNFVHDVGYIAKVNRYEIEKDFCDQRIIISSIIDGLDINEEALNSLITCAKWNNAELYLFWTRSPKKGKYGLSLELYNKVKDYLVTKLNFADETIVAEDLSIPYTSKNPLMNLEKLNKHSHIFIVPHPKQYHKMAPNDTNTEPRQIWSTGTISKLEYSNTVSGKLDSKNITLGGLYLEYDLDTNNYLPRNLIYKENYIGDKQFAYYANDTVEILSDVPAMVLGDIHFPEHDERVLEKTIKLIEQCNPKIVFLHDVFSLNSINHHELNKPITRILRQTKFTTSLEVELKHDVYLLKHWFLDRFPNIDFYIVASNHDNFLMKWLDSGDFLKDKDNCKIGCEMAAKLLNDQNPIASLFDSSYQNIKFLREKDTYQPVVGIECANHGHIGIAGSRGNINAYNKTYEQAVIGHTHSSKIQEGTVTVGTNSLLELTYTNTIMDWSHANAIIFLNSSIQLVLMD